MFHNITVFTVFLVK